ncbi:monooxygenase FAD-binding protein [Paenibacillus mucilaginosus 3016]|uniref:Monooxygenase FAD-binding protein n=2 Tax=Paenibacillus mucilaginosus TaxID=61624 RepID=H6NID3_9BACL|nr:NAD(P)/FAD-dependent oxidoreductase [Paenibacillus mucilaginosus]AFC31536.1 monooxygenase FAD-binding protein [Paenibacillus mucilaginosus 3016]AFH63881.1 monooxygenase [Paenibacillus mucilaginosus K02]WFA20077.1 NAD(P)/FAD-dependent oxidoreductase [Paenibacillus mucilaginosus]
MDSMAKDSIYDVIIVGARVAGSSLAYELSKKGMRVLLLEKGMFPSDTLSTHNFFNNAVAGLREMGVLDRLLESGAPLYKRAHVQFEDAVIDGDYPVVNGEANCLCVRRTHLDQTLFEHAASQVGVTALLGFRVTGVVTENGAVCGVTGSHKDGRTETFRGRLVVGADGRRSAVREMVKSERKICVPTEFASFVGYFEDYRQEGETCVEFYKQGDKLAIVFPTSDGLAVVGLMYPLEDQAWTDRFTKDAETAFIELAGEAFPQLSFPQRLAQARLHGSVKGLLGYDNDWWDGMGPGWALLGDAMSFKDPAVGQGMYDAMTGSRVLADILASHPDWPSSWDRMREAYNGTMEAKTITRFGMACLYTKNMPFTPEQTAVNHLIGAHPEAARAFLGMYNYANEPHDLERLIGELLQGQGA